MLVVVLIASAAFVTVGTLAIRVARGRSEMRRHAAWAEQIATWHDLSVLDVAARYVHGQLNDLEAQIENPVATQRRGAEERERHARTQEQTTTPGWSQ